MGPFEFSQMGIAVIPVYYKTKTPQLRWQLFEATLPSPEQIKLWFRPGYDTNAAVICGWRGLTVLDFDTEHSHDDWRAWAIAAGGVAREVAEKAYRVKTARGLHVYTMLADIPRCGKIKHCGSLWGDFKGTGGIVLIPPSVHPSGAVYAPVDAASTIVHVGSLADVIPEPPAKKAGTTPPPKSTLKHVYDRSQLFPPSPVRRAKEALAILDLFPDAKPSGNGRWYMARCPWHDDRSPSLRIDTQAGIAFCWAGCLGDKGMDVIGVYAKLNGRTTKEAIQELAQ